MVCFHHQGTKSLHSCKVATSGAFDPLAHFLHAASMLWSCPSVSLAVVIANSGKRFTILCRKVA